MSDQAETLRRLAQDHAPVARARVIAITSGKGGVGKTNLAVNLAIAASRLGLRTGVLDGDLGLANVDIVLGVAPEFNLGHVLYGEKRLEQIRVQGPEGIAVFAGGAGVYELANLSEWLLQRFIYAIETLDAQLDLLILDTGAGISRNVMSFVLACNELLVVTTPELTAITDAYGMIKLVTTSNPEAKVRVVVNMARDERQAQHVFRSLATVVHQFLGTEADMELLGYVPFDSSVPKAVDQQVPLVVSYPYSRAARNVGLIARRLITEGTESTHDGVGGLFQRIAEALRRKG